AESDVLEDRQMWEKCVALEDRVDVALVGRCAADLAVAEVDRPGGRLLEAADHPQRRRLAAARGAEQGEEAAALDLKRAVVDGKALVEALGDSIQPDVGRPDLSRDLVRRHVSSLFDRHQRAPAPTGCPSSTRAPQS